jgi:hypothetical protein
MAGRRAGPNGCPHVFLLHLVPNRREAPLEMQGVCAQFPQLDLASCPSPCKFLHLGRRRAGPNCRSLARCLGLVHCRGVPGVLCRHWTALHRRSSAWWPGLVAKADSELKPPWRWLLPLPSAPPRQGCPTSSRPCTARATDRSRSSFK